VEHKDLMMSFLNSLLPLPDDCEIIDLEYEPAEMLPENPMSKDSFVDVKCFDEKGRHFVVEMQMYWKHAFLNRLLYNTAKVYTKELKKNEDFGKLQPVYGLAILNDVMNKSHTHYYHRYRMTEETHSEEKINGIDITLIELPLFEPPLNGHQKMKDLWIEFLKEIGEQTKEETISQALKENKIISKALDLCREFAYTEEERAAYDKVHEGIIFRAMELSESRAEGELAGEARGEARGKKETQIAIARKLKSQGVAVSVIVAATDLSDSEIKAL
jgi:predicted transposase/invertase (TIGR01784 family)